MDYLLVAGAGLALGVCAALAMRRSPSAATVIACIAGLVAVAYIIIEPDMIRVATVGLLAFACPGMARPLFERDKDHAH
jgi:xanthosine utilization system XapX-like protein